MLMIALLTFRPSPVMRNPPMTKPTVAQVMMIMTACLPPFSSASRMSLGPSRVSLRNQLMTMVATMPKNAALTGENP